MSKNNLFIISGLISFTIYFIIFGFLIFMLKTKDVKKFDSSKNVTVLELDVVLENTKEVQKVTVKKEEIKKEANEIVKKATSKDIKQRSDLKSLFSDVSANAPTIKKEQTTNVKKSTVASRFKSDFEREKKTESVNVSKFLKNVETKTAAAIIKTSSNNYDEYYSQIYDIISARWNPLVVRNGLEARVIITIDNEGNLEYKILTKSGDETFDESLVQFLQTQKTMSFPPFTKGGSTDIEFTFKTKEE